MRKFSVRPWMVWAVVACMATTVGIVLLFLRSHPARTLTLYYRDGKTVLWNSADGTDAAPSFASYVQSQLVEKFGPDYRLRGTWKVVTTLDTALQRAALQQLQGQRPALTNAAVQTAAFAAEDVTTGQMVSWVGNLDNNAGLDNVRVRTQPGTLMLPFDYAAYLQKFPSQNADTTVNDVRQPLPGWPCTVGALPAANPAANCLWNRDFAYLGQMTLAQALAGQRLVPAVVAGLAAGNSAQNPYGGVSTVLATAAAMGSDVHCYSDAGKTKETQCYSAALIGDGAFARPQAILRGYATLAATGASMPQSVMLSARLNGKMQYTWHRSAARQIIAKSTAQAITTSLSNPTASNLSQYAPVFTTAHGTKTGLIAGTTYLDDAQNVVQFSSKYVAGFWLASQPGLQGKPLQAFAVPVTAGWFNAAQ